MKVDFLIFYSRIANLEQLLTSKLSIAYEGSYEESPSNQELSVAINVRYIKDRENGDANEESEESFICGFSIDFAAEDAEIGGAIVKGFCEELATETDMGVKHLLKLNDPYLQIINQKYANEIFNIEMRLREAISFMFVDTYGNNFYDLLGDITVNPCDGKINEEQMKSRWENQFFYLLFSKYSDLNERKLPNNAKDMIQLIGEVDDFESFKQTLTSKPIREEKYADFLASLKMLIDPIEKVRNCVAHNRTIPQKRINDYTTAKEKIDAELNILFSMIDERWDDHGPLWEEEAREAMKSALDNAKWDIENSMVTIYNSYDDRSVTCNSIDELQTELENLASDTASVCMPYDKEFPSSTIYDANYESSSILEEYQEQIEELGWDLP